MRKVPRGSASKPITTKSGKVLKVNRSLGERYAALRQDKALRKVNRLRGLPKSRFKRVAWRLQPKRLAEYWFSRDGGIMALKIVGIFIVAMFILTLGVFAYFRKDLKSITDVSGSNLGGSISYYDRTGQTLLWQDYNAVKRVPVSSDNLSPYLKDATVAIEDKDFYKHRGFDVRGIIRSAYVDVLHRGSTQGGSTITQQLVKLTRDFNQNRNIAIKMKELILAVELERNYSKDQILTSYLNVVPYGSVDYGAQTAAQDYFHTSAKNLTLAQSAFLAAIPKAPAYYSMYSPDFDKKLFLGRYNYVLDQMASQGKITKAQADAAKKTDILAQVQPQQNRYAGIQAPYFVLAARDELNRRFASQSGKVGGWKVITTLDTNMQKKSEERVAANLPNVKRYGGDEEATVTEDVQTGQMMALVGGVDFFDTDHGGINYAQWPISPGSSVKPYDYSALIDNTNAGAGSVLYDVVAPLPGYPCTNKALPPKGNCLFDFDRKSPGPMTIRYALGGSRNIPAVKATLSVVPGDTQASINKVDALANAMMDGNVGYHCYKDGVDVTTASKADQTQCFPSSGIGDGAYLHLDQHLNGLSTLGRMGQAIPATYILKIYNSTSTKPFYQWKQPKATQVVKSQTAYIINNMLSDPTATYLGGSNKFQHYKGWDIAVKTGTTNDNYDGLMMAWSTKYAVGTWVGYHTRTKSITTSMENLTEPVTRPIIEAALDSLHTSPVNWQPPAGIQTLTTFKSQIAYSTQGPTPTTDIFPSWYKVKNSNGQSVTIDKVSGKVATACTPPLAKQTLSGNSAPNTYSIDQFYPPGHTASSSSSVNTGATDDVHHCPDDQMPSVHINASDCGPTCEISATAFAGTHPLSDSNYPQFPGTITIAVNGSTICTVTNISEGVPITPCNYSPTSSGPGTITATVSDSVLYQGSDSVTVNFTAAGGTPLTLNGATPTSASWSGGSGTYTLSRADTNAVLCTTTSTSCTFSSQGNNKPLKLTDSAGDSPATGHT
jgi:penicillin-binding protein 1A